MKKILIVSDEDEMRQIYVKLFVCAGFVVRQAIDPQEVANVLIQKHIDRIIVDLDMSAVDSQLICDLIKVYDPNLKVVVVNDYPVEKPKRLITQTNNYSEKFAGQYVLSGKN